MRSGLQIGDAMETIRDSWRQAGFVEFVELVEFLEFIETGDTVETRQRCSGDTFEIQMTKPNTANNDK